MFPMTTQRVLKRATPKRKKSEGTIQEPAEYDILCGKDKTYSKHPGNLAYIDLIASYSGRYQQATTKQEKMRITKEIVSHMKNKYGSRFIKVKGQGWQEISDQMARDKVSHALRFANKGNDDSSAKTSKRKNRHRRTSSNTTMASQSSKATVSSVDTEEVPVGSLRVHSIFQRQQAILRQMNDDINCDLEVATITSVSIKPAVPETVPCEPEFNTLRSEDLDELMNEPLFENDWDNVMDLTR